jgi:hypothetical protein
MARTTGMPDNLIRSTMPPEQNGDQVDDQADAELNGEGRGGLPARKPRGRSRRVATGEKVRGRKLQLPDSVFERLSLHAIKRKSNPRPQPAQAPDRDGRLNGLLSWGRGPRWTMPNGTRPSTAFA